MTFFSRRPGFSDFHRPGFSDFPFLFPDFSYLLNIVYDPFLTRKTPFFTLFILSRASDHTTSQNIEETNAWAVPPPQIWGDRPPSPPSPPRSPLLVIYITNNFFLYLVK